MYLRVGKKKLDTEELEHKVHKEIPPCHRDVCIAAYTVEIFYEGGDLLVLHK